MLSSFIYVSLILQLLCKNVSSGHELLYKFPTKLGDLKPNELAIVQYDSRPISHYWNTSARWNKAFCEYHGHQYMFVSSHGPCSYEAFKLSDQWCKVKAMLKANSMLSTAKAFLFLDSDAVITVNYSMSTVISFVQRELKWNFTAKPVAFNQDGPGWACKFSVGRGYKLCLNSGTVFWMKGNIASNILSSWWSSSSEPYGHNLFPSKWREKVII